jgi:hypothetical protein
MGLADVQRVLVQLYTNTTLREHFLADPQGVGQELGLAATEIEQIAQLSAQQVTCFAHSLHNKRLGEVCKLLPLSHKVLGKRFSVLFRQYADTSIPSGIKKHRDDAIAFVAFVDRIAHEKGIEPEWITEVMRYEKARLLASGATRYLVICKFRYSIAKLLQGVARGDEIPPLVKRPSIMLWWRLWPGGRLWQVTTPHR